MNVHAFPSATKNFGTVSIEILKALCRGLARLIAYTSCENNPERMEYLRLVSAIEHLTRPVPVLENFLGEPYLSRLNQADQFILAKALKDCDYTLTNLETWRAKHSKPAASS